MFASLCAPGLGSVAAVARVIIVVVWEELSIYFQHFVQRIHCHAPQWLLNYCAVMLINQHLTND